jgi:hypothetical protein
MDYVSKYLKYKEKYFYLKNQYGGAQVGSIIKKIKEPGKNNLMGQIIGENKDGIFDDKKVHTGPIFIYWNTDTQQKGYLKKESENDVWNVVTSIEGLGLVSNPFILETVPIESSGMSVASSDTKFIWTVKYWGSGMINVIANSQFECFRLIRESFTSEEDTLKRISDAVKIANRQKLELKNNKETPRIFSFDIVSMSTY